MSRITISELAEQVAGGRYPVAAEAAFAGGLLFCPDDSAVAAAAFGEALGFFIRVIERVERQQVIVVQQVRGGFFLSVGHY